MSDSIKHFMLNLLITIGILGALSGLAWLGKQHALHYDITQNSSNSLEPASINILKQLDAPLSITVYATEQDEQHGNLRQIISDFIQLYQRYKSDIELTFIDPEQQPELARQADIQVNGELIINYKQRKERLTQLNEQLLSNTLLKLANNSEHSILYLTGHGERKLDGIANHDMGSLFGQRLQQKWLPNQQPGPDHCPRSTTQHRTTGNQSATTGLIASRGG